MATVVNFIDTTLQAAAARTVNLPSAQILLTPSAPAFHIAADGTITPASITFTATLIDLDAPVVFNAAGGSLTGLTGHSATLAGADMPGTSATVIASVTVNGKAYTAPCTIAKIRDAQAGAPGADGLQVATVRLYQWAPTPPASPKGGSMLIWAGASNGAYTGSDGWSVTVPDNPGTPGWRLYVAAVTVSATARTATTAVGYAGAAVEAWSQNGAAGASGVQSGAATVYQWAATIPAGPAGTGALKWADGALDTAPGGWTLVPGPAPVAGMTLWAARVQVTDSAVAASTAFNWSAAAIMAIGYAGTNGGSGLQGASYVTAYIASSVIAANGAPAQTTGRTSLPEANSSGLAGAWSAAVPALADGQRMYQSDGIYDPATDRVTWSIPYWSSLKVGTLSAITANLGAINAGSINLGNGTFTVDNAGNLVCRSIKIVDPATGETVLQAGGPLNAKYAAPGTLNSDMAPSIQAAKDAADAAAQAAAAAKGQADAANNLIGAIVSDGVLSRAEKPDVITNWTAASDEYQGIANRADTLGVSRANYDAAFTALYQAIISISPAYNDMTQDSPADGPVLRSRFAAYYSARQTLLNTFTDRNKAIADAAATTSTWTGVSGAGKPQDNATVGADWTNLKAGIGGRNQLSNSLPNKMNLWNPGFYGSAVGAASWHGPGNDPNGWSIYSPDRKGCIAMHATSWPNGSVGDLYSTQRFQVTPQRYEAGVTISSHRCLVWISITWLDAAGQYISETGGNQVNTNYFDANSTSAPPRSVAIGNAPSNARTAYVFVRMTPNGESDPYAFLSQFYFGEALPAQTTGSVYSPSIKDAQDAIIAMSSDNILSRSEKIDLVKEWGIIDANWANIRAQANNLGVSYADYDAKHTATSEYLLSMSPRWSDTTQDTYIDRNVFNESFRQLYAYKAACQNAISAKAATMATADGFSGIVGGDNLTVNSSFERSANGSLADGFNIYNNAGGNEPTGAWLDTGRSGGRAQVIYWTSANHIDTKGITAPICSTGWVPGRTYMVSFYARTTNLQSTSAMAMYWNTGPAAQTAVSNPNLSTSWQRYVFKLVWGGSVEAGGYGFISVGGGEGPGNVWFDDLMVVEGDVMPAYYPSAAEAATMSTWAGVSGAGKPADNATNGATIGINLGGQFNAGNVPSLFVPGAITDTQIGGNLRSSNWNGSTGAGGVGWLLERATGNLYCNNIRTRGAVMGGDFYDYAWPEGKDGNGNWLGGYYMDHRGLLLGNARGNSYIQIESNGNFRSPWINCIGGQVSVNGGLSALSATIGLFRTANWGGRTEIADNVTRVYDENNTLRVKIGNLSL